MSAPAPRCLGALAAVRPPRAGPRGGAMSREIWIRERGPHAALGSVTGRGFHRDAPCAARSPDCLVRLRPDDERRPTQRPRDATCAPRRANSLARPWTPTRTSPERSRYGDDDVVVLPSEGSAPRRASRPGSSPGDRASVVHRTDGSIGTSAPGDRAALRCRTRARRGPAASSSALTGRTARNDWRAGACGTIPRAGLMTHSASHPAGSTGTIDWPSTFGVPAAPKRPIVHRPDISCRMVSPSRTNVVNPP